MMRSKNCKQCNQTKKLSEFHKAGARSIGGVRPRCKLCINKNNREHWSHYYTSNKKLIAKRRMKRYKGLRKHFLQKFYGLSEEAYQKLWNKQKGKCAICGNPETKRKNGRSVKLCVDHNHKTSVVRGLLCFRCNLAVGNMLDEPKLAEQLITYLNRWKKC